MSQERTPEQTPKLTQERMMAGDARPVPKSRRSLAPLSRLLPYVAHYPGLVLGALASLLVAALATLSLPIAVRRMIDNGFGQTNEGLITSYFTMLVIVAAVLAAASGLRYYFVVSLGERVVADLRRDVFRHVATLSAQFFDASRSGEIVSRLTADATQIKSVVGATSSVALRNIIMAIGAIGLMVVTSPRLSLLVVGAVPFVLLPLVAFGRAVRSRSRRAQDMLADAGAYAGEQIAAIRTVQAYTSERAVTARFGAIVEAAFQAARSSIMARAALTFFAIFMVLGSVVAVLWFGANDVMEGRMTPGTLSQFVLYAVLAAGALGALSEVWGEVSQAAGAAERMGELLDERPIIKGPTAPQFLPVPPVGSIEFRNVCFAYPGRPDMPTLSDLSFTIDPGDSVAFVGRSGAGKSTIFSLLMRFYDPIAGQILVDGVDIREVDPIALRERMAVVPQDVAIFTDTIASNIGYGQDRWHTADVEAAGLDAQVAEFVEPLPNAYDTPVGERGVTLSGGQRQRIGIARAILRDAPILLLDEATSALDAESEAKVQTGLDRLMRGRTTLIIAHRLSTVIKADRILMLENGTIVEEGTHRQLVAENGRYARLARLQFDGGSSNSSQAAE